MPRGVAALATGFGGLLVEAGAQRRLGLLLGTSTESSSAVLALYFLGLGLGAWWAANRGLGRSPLKRSALLYAVVAVTALGFDVLFRSLPGLGRGFGLFAAVLFPGIPALAMGAAFPGLFSGMSGIRSAAWLFGLNLGGATVAALWAPNWLLPGLGLTAVQGLAAGAYGLAAIVCLLGSPFGQRGASRIEEAQVPPDPLSEGPRASIPILAFGTGFLLLGYELHLLRRLPFQLEGFHPTFAGVLAAVLCSAALGSIAASRLRARLGGRTLLIVLITGAFAVVLGLAEPGRPAAWVAAAGLDRFDWFGSRDLALQLRSFLSALFAAFPISFCSGAVPPLLVAESGLDRVRSVGRVSLFEGIGGLAGSLWIGLIVPSLHPESVFVSGPMWLATVTLVVVALGLGARLPALACAAGVLVLSLITGPGTPWGPVAPFDGSIHHRPGEQLLLDHRTDSVTTASVIYDRRAHSTQLYTDEFRAAETGPGTSYQRVLGHLPFLLREGLGDVAILALGTGTTAEAVVDWPDARRIDVVEISSAVLSLVDSFSGDGPVASDRGVRFLRDERVRVTLDDGRSWLQSRAERSLDLLTMEPLLPQAPRTAQLYSREFYELVASRLRDEGLCVQWVPTHAVPRETFEVLLRTFGQAFDHCSVWLVDQSTLLVGSRSELPPPLQAGLRLGAAPRRAARELHEAGIARAVDLRIAHLVTDPPALREGSVLTDSRPVVERVTAWSSTQKLTFFTDNLGYLIELVGLESPTTVDRLQARAATGLGVYPFLDPGGRQAQLGVKSIELARRVHPDSTMLHLEETRALRALLRAALENVNTGAVSGLGNAGRRHARRDPGSALARYLGGGDRDAESRERTARQALAIDPYLLASLPESARWEVAQAPEVSSLEDLSVLPDGESLLALATGGSDRAFALRAAFPVRIARAAVEVARDRELTEAESKSLRPCLDPASGSSFCDVVFAARGPRSCLREWEDLWRLDLPTPLVFSRLVEVDQDGSVRRSVARMLGARTDPRARRCLAVLLEDPEPAVREAAETVLRATFPEIHGEGPSTVGDEQWRDRVVRALLSLHDRTR
ncbi:MAG: HEAT repeat domain-containing protein [Planctomycetota bacterium]